MSRHPLQAVVTGTASLTSALRLLPPESRPSWTEPLDVRSRVAQMRRVQRELNHKDLSGAGPISWQLAMRAHFQKGCDLSDLEAALLCAELPERAWPQALTGLLDTMHQLDRLDNEEVAACTGLSVQEVNATPMLRPCSLTRRPNAATRASGWPSSAAAPQIFSASTVVPTPRRPAVYRLFSTATSSSITTLMTSIPSEAANSAARSKFMMSPV